MMKKIKGLAKKKSVIGFFAVAVVAGTVYETQFNQAEAETRYILTTATRGTLVNTISASGQVSGLNQVEVKPKVSGDVVRILVETGEEVTEGTPILEIDRRSALKTVRDASRSVEDSKLSYDSALLSYQKAKQPADAVSIIQAENSLNQAKRDLEDLKDGTDDIEIKQAENSLSIQLQNTKMSADGVTPQVVRDAYDEAVPVVKSVSQTLDQAVRDADTILGIDTTNLNDTYESLLSILDTSRLFTAKADYRVARNSVDALKKVADGLKVSDESTTNIDAALVAAQDSLKVVEPLMQDMQDVLANTISSASFSQSSLDSLRNTIQSDRNNVSTKLTSITNQNQTIEQARTTYQTALLNVDKAKNDLDKLKEGATANALATAEERVRAAQASYDELKLGLDPIDEAVQQNTLAQRRSSLVAAQNKLSDAQETLDDYTVKAPFDGIIADISTQRADSVSPSAGVATILTKAKIATLSLNEVDAAKIEVGQKATLTFDAVSNLTIAGSVSEIDSIGTVSQGVVSYEVKVAFLTEDDRVKPGMSVNAVIVTNIKTDVLLLPNSAVKTDASGLSTVTLLPGASKTDVSNAQGVISNATPQIKNVEVGSSNDESTEIVSGVEENEIVVSRTVTQTAAASAAKQTTSSSALRIPGMGAMGGGPR
ncbi:MAG: HlyD family efflux transporter periplasmic adaptor subunit [Patescibacteria group bacterium]|nr:HlyD family efflux transporter periplasmic adaptor subunit [Patescibacteria group bacterium]